MVIFTNIAFDIAGPVVLKEDPEESDYRARSRRITRTKTLDGGVDLDDAGFSHGDSTFAFKVMGADESQYLALNAMLQTYGSHRCATREGVFIGALQIVRMSGADLLVTFLPRQKTSG